MAQANLSSIPSTVKALDFRAVVQAHKEATEHLEKLSPGDPVADAIAFWTNDLDDVVLFNPAATLDDLKIKIATIARLAIDDTPLNGAVYKLLLKDTRRLLGS